MTAVAEPAVVVDAPSPPRPPKLGRIMMIALSLLDESPDNTRQTYEENELNDLANSIREKGILNELRVRPRDGGRFEIGAGSRRKRAAVLAGLEAVPCNVKEMDDQEFLELIIIENNQRRDVHPLEEAEGYKKLILRHGLDTLSIAQRIGRDVDYVVKRLNLTNLVDEAKELFLAHRMAIGHAVILSRLQPLQQEKAISPRSADAQWGRLGGLWSEERSEADPAQEKLDVGKSPLAKYDGLKTVTVDELQTWVNDTIRLDVSDPELIEDDETAMALQNVEELAEAGVKLKVVAITHDHRAPDATRDESERTYGKDYWKRVPEDKPCDFTVLGVVKAGPGAGKSFPVCVARDRCKTHWAKEVAARERRQKENTKRGGVAVAAGESAAQQKQSEQSAARQKAHELATARHAKAEKQLVRAVEISLGRLPALKLIQLVTDEDRDLDLYYNEKKQLRKTKTADAFLRAVAWEVVRHDVESPYDFDNTAATFKALGLDYSKLLDEYAPVESKGDPKKPAAKKKGKR